MVSSNAAGQEWVRTIRDVPTAQLNCMPGGFNHHWEQIQKPFRRGLLRRITSRCAVCGKERARILDATDGTMDLQYTTPNWHVKVEEPYDAFDVATELERRSTKEVREGKSKTGKVRRLRSVS